MENSVPVLLARKLGNNITRVEEALESMQDIESSGLSKLSPLERSKYFAMRAYAIKSLFFCTASNTTSSQYDVGLH